MTRGTRPGALAPRGNATRFTWSRAGVAPEPAKSKNGKQTIPETPAEPV